MAFEKQQGLFKWLAVSFNLIDSPGTFMRVLRPCLDSFVNGHVNNILVFNET
jgi:hypothetical protein